MENLRNSVVELNNYRNIVDNMLDIRGLTLEYAEDLLFPTEDFEESIDNYKNIKEGMFLLLKAIENNDNICIRVDCDADGYFSSTIAYTCISDILEYDNIFFTIGEGKNHSITLEKIDELIENDIKLVILPDSGSGDFAPLKKMVDNGIKVLILDHHIIKLTEEELEYLGDNVALINNQDGQVENVHLSGTGVTYKFFKKLLDELNLDIGYAFLDLVAASILSDACSLRDSYENRYYFNLGTKIKNITNPFLDEIAKSCKKKPSDIFTIEDLSYKISPIINATIRLGKLIDKEILLNALIGNDELIEHRKNLITYPAKARLRGQTFQKDQRILREKYSEEASVILEENNLTNGNIIFFIDYDNVIDDNLRGLICNNLADRYNRPCFIGTLFEEDGVRYISGSARSVDGLDLIKVCSDTGLFDFLRGHEGAFGYSIREDLVETFKEVANDKVLDYDTNIYVDRIYDKKVPKSNIRDIVKFENLWCNEIPCPQFLITNVTFKVSDIEKRGTSTYVFKNEDIEITREMGSKLWFEQLTKNAEEITLDVLVEFRKKYGRGKIMMNNCERIK